jgi:hypothetical protein
MTWESELSKAFLKEEVQMAIKHMKKCSPALAIKEMQIKITLRFHLAPVRIATIKNINNIQVLVAQACNSTQQAEIRRIKAQN